MALIHYNQGNLGYNGTIGICKGCKQPRQRLVDGRHCLACIQAAARDAGKRHNRRLPKRGTK